jgi:hypothetical protein
MRFPHRSYQHPRLNAVSQERRQTGKPFETVSNSWRQQRTITWRKRAADDSCRERTLQERGSLGALGFVVWLRGGWLGFAGARVLRQHQLDGVGGFRTALLL